MTNQHLWRIPAAIQTGPEIVGGFDVGFDRNIPEETVDQLMDFVYWVEDHFSLPVTLWVDFKYNHYLMDENKKRVDYKFYSVPFTSYPSFHNWDDIPVIELPVNRPVEEILPAFIDAISHYFLWLTRTDTKPNAEEILQAYTQCL